jgi:hypothetical protein
MQAFILVLLGLAVAGGAMTGLSSSSVGDSCVAVDGPNITNGCKACVKVTVQNLRSGGEQTAASLAVGEPRSVQVQAGEKVTLPGAARFAITGIDKCE